MKASAGVLAAVVKGGELEEHGVLAHAALRLLTAFADDPLCNRAFCHSGIHSALSARMLTAKGIWHRPAAPFCAQAGLGSGMQTLLLSHQLSGCAKSVLYYVRVFGLQNCRPKLNIWLQTFSRRL